MNAARAAGHGLPERFAEIEELTETWMEFFIDIFSELDTERSSGWGVVPIPVSKIREVAVLYDYPEEDEFIFFIRGMDRHYMKVQNAKNKQESSHIRPKSGGSRQYFRKK